MGYTTTFKGAFKITPMVNPALACRFNAWLNNRHNFRDAPLLLNEIADKTLYGVPGENGEYVMPSIEKQIRKMVEDGTNPFLAPHLTGYCGMGDSMECQEAFATTGEMDDKDKAKVLNEWCKTINQVPKGLPSLWSDFIIVNDREGNCSYLKWDRSEKSYEMDKWAQILLDLLSSMHFTLEGTICAKGEDPGDYWSMQICEKTVLVEYSQHRIDGATYEKEAKAAEQSSEKQAKTIKITEAEALALLYPSSVAGNA